MRAVADTNVYISALDFGGAADSVLALARAGTVTLFANDDPDNRILECAVESAGQAVITGDHDLRQLGTFRSIRILSPREFLDEQEPQAGPGPAK